MGSAAVDRAVQARLSLSADSGRARIHELTEIASLLTSTFDIDQILSTLMDAALRMADAEVGALWLQEGGLRSRVTWGLEQETVEQVRLDSDETAPERVLRTGEIFWSPDCAGDARFAHLPDTVRIESLLAVPLQHKGQPIGCIVIVNRADSELDPGDAESLEALASFAAVALENARLHQAAVERRALERELSMARQVQLALLPGCDPEGTGIQWGSVYYPMGKVGGDYYDYVGSPEGRSGVVIGDVSDKGLAAALFMAVTRSLVRRESSGMTDPADVVRRVNRTLCEDTERYASVFVTLFHGQFDRQDRSFHFANAGHCLPLWLPKDGEPAWLSARGTVLGQFPEAEYEPGRVLLSPGDLLVLYTDGVTEAQSPHGEWFRQEGLLRAVREAREMDVVPLALHIVDRAREFVRPAGLSDDLTVLVGRVE